MNQELSVCQTTPTLSNFFWVRFASLASGRAITMDGPLGSKRKWRLNGIIQYIVNHEINKPERKNTDLALFLDKRCLSV